MGSFLIGDLEGDRDFFGLLLLEGFIKNDLAALAEGINLDTSSAVI